MGFLSELTGNDYGSQWSNAPVKIDEPNPAYLDKALQLPLLGMKLKAADDAKKGALFQTPLMKQKAFNPIEQTKMDAKYAKLNAAVAMKNEIGKKITDEFVKTNGRQPTASELAYHPDFIKVQNYLQEAQNDADVGRYDAIHKTRLKNQETFAKDINENGAALRFENIEDEDFNNRFKEAYQQLANKGFNPQQIALTLAPEAEKYDYLHTHQHDAFKFKKEEDLAKEAGIGIGDSEVKNTMQGLMEKYGAISATDLLASGKLTTEEKNNVKQLIDAKKKYVELGTQNNALNASVNRMFSNLMHTSLKDYWLNNKGNITLSNGKEEIEINDPQKAGFEKMMMALKHDYVPSRNGKMVTQKTDGSYMTLRNYLDHEADWQLNPMIKDKKVKEWTYDFSQAHDVGRGESIKQEVINNAMIKLQSGMEASKREIGGGSFIFGKDEEGKVAEQSVLWQEVIDEKLRSQIADIAKGNEGYSWVKDSKTGDYHNINANQLGDITKQLNKDNLLRVQYRVAVPNVYQNGKFAMDMYVKDKNGNLKKETRALDQKQYEDLVGKTQQLDKSKLEKTQEGGMYAYKDKSGNQYYIPTMAYGEFSVKSTNDEVRDKSGNNVNLEKSEKFKQGDQKYNNVTLLVPINQNLEQQLGSAQSHGKKHTNQQRNLSSGQYYGTSGEINQISTGVNVNTPRYVPKQEKGGYINPFTGKNSEVKTDKKKKKGFKTKDK